MRSEQSFGTQSQIPHAPNLSAPRIERDIQILSENLRDTLTRIGHLMDGGDIHSKALANSFASACVHQEQSADTSVSSTLETGGALLSFIEQHLSSLPQKDTALPEHQSFLSQGLDPFLGAEQLCFLHTLITEHTSLCLPLIEEMLGHADPLAPAARGTIVYQHSIYADEAFLRFSRLLPTAKACYSDSFTNICEQMLGGQYEYCILPLETTEDGKLVRFYSLIERYELKIVLTCSVSTSDNRRTTTFGLCRRGLVWPQLLIPEKNFVFECLVFPEAEHMSLAKLLSAAKACSLTLVRADCLPRSDEEILMGAGYPFALCFEARAGQSPVLTEHWNFLTFLLFLGIHSPNHLPLGLYQQI